MNNSQLRPDKPGFHTNKTETRDNRKEAKILTQYTEEEWTKIQKREREFKFQYAWNKYLPRWLRFTLYIAGLILTFWFLLHVVINLVATDKIVHREMLRESVIKLEGVSDLGEGKYDIRFELSNVTNAFGTSDFSLRIIKNVGIVVYGSIVTLKDVIAIPGEKGDSYIEVTDGGPSLINGFLKKVDITLYISKPAKGP